MAVIYVSCLLDLLFAQVVNMEFEGGVTAAFTMVAFTEEMCHRKTTIYGSKVGKIYKHLKYSVILKAKKKSLEKMH